MNNTYKNNLLTEAINGFQFSLFDTQVKEYIFKTYPTVFDKEYNLEEAILYSGLLFRNDVRYLAISKSVEHKNYIYETILLEVYWKVFDLFKEYAMTFEEQMLLSVLHISVIDININRPYIFRINAVLMEGQNTKENLIVLIIRLRLTALSNSDQHLFSTLQLAIDKFEPDTPLTIFD